MRRTPRLAAALGLALALPLTACGAEPGPEQGTAPPPPPRGLTAQASSGTSVHVMWNRAAEGAGVSGYEVYRGKTRVKTVPAAKHMVDVEGLKPDTRYAFRVRARAAEGGYSAFSGRVTVTTRPHTAEDSKPPTAPGGLTAHASGPRAATLNWTAAKDNQEVTAYDILQRDAKIHSVGGDTTGALVTGLRPGTDYTFTVRARDAANNSSAPSGSVRLKTPPAADAPDPADTAPAAFRVATHAEDGAHYLDLSWQPPRTDGLVTEYQIYLNGKQATTLSWGGEAPKGRAEHSFFVTREAGETYRVKLRARLPDGNWGAFSSEQKTTTG